jgi:hypothetical protein
MHKGFAMQIKFPMYHLMHCNLQAAIKCLKQCKGERMGIKTWSVESLPNQGATNPELKTSW